MNRRLVTSMIVAAAAHAAAGAEPVERLDAVGDAVVRRTDAGNDGPIGGGAAPHDLVSISMGAWNPTSPAADPYTGAYVPAAGAHFVRLDVVLAGVVAPPGTLGFGGTTFDPYAFGNSPLYGYVEIDVDGDADTGGELGGAAQTRFLGVAARFGARAPAPLTARAALATSDLDADFFSPPQFERSGADFSLALCGCHQVTIVSEAPASDGVFGPGDTWIVRSRFFQRAGGYRGASGVFGGSDFGLYDPPVNLRFRHNVQTNRTTVSLVYPLDMAGAALLAGQPEQPIDQLIEVGGSHHSVVEALADLVLGAQGLNQGPLTGPVLVLTANWATRNPGNYLNPAAWRSTAVFALPYATPDESLFVWTDALGLRSGDVTGDGVVDADDHGFVLDRLAQLDGSPGDADGTIDGVVTLPSFAAGFDIADIDYDGDIDAHDVLLALPPCDADYDGNGTVDTGDFFSFMGDYFGGIGDFNHDGNTDTGDFFAFAAAYFAGCN